MIYLLKSKSGDPDPYEIMNPQYVPIMDCELLNSQLVGILQDKFDGILITSQRAVDSLQQILRTHKFENLKFDTPVYTVGPATAHRLRLCGFTNVIGEETGNGLELGKVMDHMDFKSQKILFLAGEIHRPFLRTFLTTKGAEVTTSIVYRTTPLPPSPKLQLITPQDWLVFFSPSHTSEVLKFLKALDTMPRIAAIGPTTYEFLISNDIKVDITAKSPTPQALYTGINNYIAN